MARRFTTLPGETIQDAARAIVDRAGRHGEIVWTDFNGVRLEADPECSVADVFAQYDLVVSAREERQRALSAAEAAVVKAAEEWHARRAMIGCTKEVEADLLAALGSACRELAERRGN